MRRIEDVGVRRFVPPGDYDSVVSGLFARQPEHLIPDLERIAMLCQLLGRPELAYPAVQITGTNGKGSTAAMISCLIEACGATVGTYTSPHLQDVRERIRVNRERITRVEFASALARMAPSLAEVDSQARATFFEVLTALSFLHFRTVGVDVGVFEVGMGGTWDATNLARGKVAVLTEIGLDHPELGGSIEAVAAEKVGIVKAGATVVSAGQPVQAAGVVEEAAARAGGTLLIEGRDFGVTRRSREPDGQRLAVQTRRGSYELHLRLHGAHQATNAACAIAAAEALVDGPLEHRAAARAMSMIRSPGRLEVVPRRSSAKIVLDAAHNPSGATALVRALRRDLHLQRPVFVVGMLRDKDVDAVIKRFADCAGEIVVTPAPSARSAPVNRLIGAARASGVRAVHATDVSEAIEVASDLAGPDGSVVVTGSLTVVGAARSVLGLPVE